MDIDDVEKVIKSLPDRWGNLGWESWSDVGESRHTEIRYVKLVETVGRNTDGSVRMLVFEVGFSDLTTKYYRIEGYFSSYEGNTWDGRLVEVTPVERNVTIYEEV